MLIERDVAFELDSELFAPSADGTMICALADQTLLPPVQPGKIDEVGPNYLAQVTEYEPNLQVSDEPVLFLEPPPALIGNGVDCL